MAVSVSPTLSKPSHHIKLSKGGTEVGLVLCDGQGNRDDNAIERAPYPTGGVKITQGESKHSDAEPPFRPVVQEDWSGGRGMETFEDDETRYFDGGRIDGLRAKRLISAGQETYSQLVDNRGEMQELPGSVSWRALTGTEKYIARQFTAPRDVTTIDGWVWVRRIGSPGGLRLAIYDDNNGDPGTSQTSKTLTANDVTTDTISLLKVFDWGNLALTEDTTYHIVINATGDNDDDDNHWEVGVDTDASGSKSSDGTTWTAHDEGMYYRVAENMSSGPFVAQFFEYKEQLYFITKPVTGSTEQFFMNGWRGVADSNSGQLNKLIDATQNWTTDELVGCVVKIVAGKGYDDSPNWRKITANDATSVTVDPAWNIAHDDTTEYVILGSDKWHEINIPVTTAPVLDVAVANNIVYFAQGEDAVVRKYRAYNNAGTWTDEWGTSGSGSTGTKAHLFAVLNDHISGPVIYMGRHRRDTNYTAEVWYDNAPDSWDSEQILGGVVLDDARDAWDEQTVTNVTAGYEDGWVTFAIRNGVISAVTIQDAGSGYQVGDLLTLVETGAAGGRVQVTTVGGSGEITGISLNAAGSGYTTGVKTTTGGNGTGATINVTTVVDFGTGVIGSKAIDEVDVRFTNKIVMGVKSTVPLDAGELELVLSDQANVANPIITLPFPSIRPLTPTQVTLEYDAFDTAGAEAIVSIGLQLTADVSAKDIQGVTRIEIYKGPTAYANTIPIPVGIHGDKITGMELYGDPEQVYVFTERGFGEIRNNQFVPIPLREMASVRSDRNGAAHWVRDVYLYFSLLDGVEKYYRQTVDDIGPNRDAGLPSDRQGPVVKGLPYPGRDIIAIDAGPSGYSSVLMSAGAGWHEIYRAPQGHRIFNMFIQPIPGSSTARLWISQYRDIVWVPISLAPENDSDFRYTHESYITTGRITTGVQDIEKLWEALRLATKNLDSSTKIIAEYRTNNNTSWTKLSSEFTTSPSQEVDFSSTHDVSGKWIQVRLRLLTEDNTVSPIVYGMVVEALGELPIKQSWTLTFRAADGDIDLNQEPDDYTTAKAKLDQLDAWANSPLPVLMNSIGSLEDNRYVKILAPPVRPIRRIIGEDGRVTYICQLKLLEV